MKKKVLSVVLAVVMLICSLAVGFTSYAKSEKLVLDTLFTNAIEGEQDKVWYIYTPQHSGTYSFLSFSVRRAEAYLMVRETDENGLRQFKTLAYSNSDPNYEANAHNEYQFCLTHHLDAGETYYFLAGWQFDTTASSTMKVKLRCDEYDNQAIKAISVSCNASLTYYTDGEWRTDADSKQYYYYNYSKIIQNMTVTLTYKDGHTSSVTGKDKIDGYDIRYSQDQVNNHWYIASDTLNYTANILTVSVLNVSTDYNVNINSGTMCIFKGKVVDCISGEPVPNASVRIKSGVVAATNGSGEFSFAYSAGRYQMSIEAENAVPRTVITNIDITDNENNNHLSTPVSLLMMDYVDDDIINGLDYAYIRKKLSGEQRDLLSKRFADYADFTKADYPEMIL